MPTGQYEDGCGEGARVELELLCGKPPGGKGVCAGLELTCGPGITTPPWRPLLIILAGVLDETFASKKQLASPKRSSVKAKAYPSQPSTPQHAMRQAPSEGTARGASVRGVPTRSVRGRKRKREAGRRDQGRVEVGLAVWLKEDVTLEEGVMDGVSLGAGRHGKATPEREEAGTVVWPKSFLTQHSGTPASDKEQVWWYPAATVTWLEDASEGTLVWP